MRFGCHPHSSARAARLAIPKFSPPLQNLSVRPSGESLCRAIAACLLLAATTPGQSQSLDQTHSSCAGVDRSLTNERAVELAPLIAKQLRSSNPPVAGASTFESDGDLTVKVLKSFSFHGWRIFQVSTNMSEDAYVFYRQRPEDGKFVALYGGTAGYDPADPNGAAKAEYEVESWLRHEMADIPSHLTDCFAWHFVVERTR